MNLPCFILYSCANEKVFVGLSSVPVRLDVWHFGWRIGKVCSHEDHPLFPKLMWGISNAIFQWIEADLALVIQAKKSEMRANGLDVAVTDDNILDNHLKKKFVCTHARRLTRLANKN